MSKNGRRTKRNRKYYARRLYRLQGGRCFLCPDPMKIGATTRDHVHPRRRLRGFVGNVLLAHQACNLRKADRDPYPCELIYLDAINLRLSGEATA